jgi:hypothetical protein
MSEMPIPATCEMEIPDNAFNPVEPFLRMDRMPTIWCPGCGIGTTVNCFARALLNSKADLNKVAIVSGIGCSGRVAGYLRLADGIARQLPDSALATEHSPQLLDALAAGLPELNQSNLPLH